MITTIRSILNELNSWESPSSFSYFFHFFPLFFPPHFSLSITLFYKTNQREINFFEPYSKNIFPLSSIMKNFWTKQRLLVFPVIKVFSFPVVFSIQTSLHYEINMIGPPWHWSQYFFLRSQSQNTIFFITFYFAYCTNWFFLII